MIVVFLNCSIIETHCGTVGRSGIVIITRPLMVYCWNIENLMHTWGRNVAWCKSNCLLHLRCALKFQHSSSSESIIPWKSLVHVLISRHWFPSLKRSSKLTVRWSANLEILGSHINQHLEMCGNQSESRIEQCWGMKDCTNLRITLQTVSMFACWHGGRFKEVIQKVVQKVQTAGTAALICSLRDISQCNLFTHSSKNKEDGAEWPRLFFTADLLHYVLLELSVCVCGAEEEIHWCLEFSMESWCALRTSTFKTKRLDDKIKPVQMFLCFW